MGERIAILPNRVTCSFCLEHTARLLHWESGMHENERGALSQDMLNSKIATGCNQSEFALRSTRSTRTRRKNILWPTQRIEEFRWNLEQHRWLQNSWHTPFYSRTAGYKSQRQGQADDSAVREPPVQGIFPSGLERRRRGSISSAKNRKICSPTWTTPRSSNFAKPLPKSNAPIAIHTGRSALSIALVEDVKNRRKELKSSTRTTTTSHQFLAMLLKRITVAVPKMDLLSDSECTTRLQTCCKKFVDESMEDIHPCSRDGIITTHAESLCQILDGPRST